MKFGSRNAKFRRCPTGQTYLKFSLHQSFLRIYWFQYLVYLKKPTAHRFRGNMDADYNVDLINALHYLRNIRRITGTLIVRDVAELESLSFLQNLVTVENRGNESFAIEITNVSSKHLSFGTFKMNL